MQTFPRLLLEFTNQRKLVANLVVKGHLFKINQTTIKIKFSNGK